MNTNAVAGNVDFRLDGRVALVTGASRGIGFALASALGRAGARVVVNAQNAERVAAATASLRHDGIDATGVPFDVLDEDGIARAVGQMSATSAQSTFW